MTPTLLKSAGELLYGPRWQTDLADALGVSARTMRHWASGDREMPEGAWGDVLDLVRERMTAIRVWLGAISPRP